MVEIIGGIVGLLGMTLYAIAFSSQNAISIFALLKAERKITSLYMFYFLYLIVAGVFFLYVKFDQESFPGFMIELLVDVFPALLYVLLTRRYKK